MSFFEELKRRNVIKVGIAYAVVAWLVLQFSDVVLNNIEAPGWVFQAIMLVLGIGFLLALFFAWAFEMTPEGIKKEKDVDRSQSITTQTGRKLDFVIIGLLVVVAGYFIWESRFAGEDAQKGPGSITTPAQTTETPSSPLIEPDPPKVNSIAVLPFANRSRLEDDEFFSDGIHDDLLTQLAKIHDLKVISRTSMMKYKDTQLSIPEIAAELGVSTILEGGVQRAGNRVRINAQLIDVSNDQHLWAETYDREMTMENIFDIQSEITRQIVTAVRGELTESESALLGQLPTRSLEAYEAYLRGMAFINLPDYDQTNYIQAESWLYKAVELDPDYTQAWFQLTVVHGQAMWIGYDASPERLEAARNAVENAVRSGPGSAEALAAEGEYLYRIENNFAESVEKYQAAHDLAPGDVEILGNLAVAQRRAGLSDESIGNFRKVYELDPQNSRNATLLTDTLINLNRFEQATPLVDEFMKKFPDARDLRGQRIRLYLWHEGDVRSARVLADSLPASKSNEFYQLSIDLPLVERDFQRAIDAFDIPEIAEMEQNRGYMGFEGWIRGFSYRMLGNEESARAAFEGAIDLVETAEPTGTNTDAFEQQFVSLSYAGLGRFDEALAAIKKAIDQFELGGDKVFSENAKKVRAVILGMAGKREESLEEIKRLLEAPTGFAPWDLKLHPQWDFFRDDPRFVALYEERNE